MTKFAAVLMMEASTVVLQDWSALLKLLNIKTLNKTNKRKKTARRIISTWKWRIFLTLWSAQVPEASLKSFTSYLIALHQQLATCALKSNNKRSVSNKNLFPESIPLVQVGVPFLTKQNCDLAKYLIAARTVIIRY